MGDSEIRAAVLQSNLNALSNEQSDEQSFKKQYEDCKWELVGCLSHQTELQKASEATDERLKDNLQVYIMRLQIDNGCLLN